MVEGIKALQESQKFRIEHRNAGKTADDVLDTVIDATQPGRRWYGAPSPRGPDSYSKHQADIKAAMASMTTDELSALGKTAFKRAERTGDAPPDERKFLQDIAEGARIEAGDRTNQAEHDFYEIAAIQSTELRSAAIEELGDDRLMQVNRFANERGCTSRGALTAQERSTCEAVNWTAYQRLGDISQTTGNYNDRYLNRRERGERRVHDISYRANRGNMVEEYLGECTPTERKDTLKGIKDEIKEIERRYSPPPRDADIDKQTLDALETLGKLKKVDQHYSQPLRRSDEDQRTPNALAMQGRLGENGNGREIRVHPDNEAQSPGETPTFRPVAANAPQAAIGGTNASTPPPPLRGEAGADRGNSRSPERAGPER